MISLLRFLLVALLGTSLPLMAEAQAPALQGQVVYEHLVIAGGGEAGVSAPGAVADLAVALPLGSEASFLNFGLRAGMGEEGERLAPQLFLRVLGGDETWKTFFDLGLLGRIQPSWSVGPRMGIGIQREFGRHLGVYAMAGGSAGFGSRFHIGFDGGIGLQIRFGEGASRVHYDYVH